MATQADENSVSPCCRNRWPNTTAPTEIVPCVDRSIEPMMMNVTPMATISAAVEEIAMRPKFFSEKNTGLMAVKASTSTTNTRNGAHWISFGG